MKIVYCIAGTYNSGGMERVLANKANWLTAHGHEVTIVTSDQRGRKPFFALDSRIRCFDLGIDYEATNSRSFFTKFSRYPLKKWRHRRRLSKLLRRLRPDITVSMFCGEASFLPSIADGSRKVLEVHFSRFKRLQYGRRGLWRLADRWLSRADLLTARRFDRFVTLTRQDSAYWSGIDDIEVIPNAVSFETDDTADTSSRTVIAVGRLSHQKGFDRLLDAWAEAVAANPGWQLKIYGSGPLRQQLQQRIDELGISSSAHICAPVGDIRGAYLEASILAMTSRYEGLPMALIEAQTCGLPIVAMSCKCGPADVVSDGVDGWLTPDDDTAAFASRLSQLMADSDMRRRFALRARENSRRFATDRIMARWTDLFHRLTSSPQ